MKFLQFITLLLLVSTAAQAGLDATSDQMNDKSLIFPDTFKDCKSDPLYLTVKWSSPPGENVSLNLQMSMTGNSDDFRFEFIGADGCNCKAIDGTFLPTGPCKVTNGESCTAKVVSAPNNPGVKKKKLNFDGSYQLNDSTYEVSDSVAIFATSYPAGHPDSDPNTNCPNSQ
jgi:hypothetical protein